ncbi:C2H2-type zinc finger protein [Buttiauxella massiliensis]|uniref:C2H2-type zinc finger protein n=1 Tax=Buttiauxella massiliensis TaxID=2831590 RepID=UPI00125EFE31|nr:C2H2-type zinc finger protein [Buttiauxella massiliensis]
MPTVGWIQETAIDLFHERGFSSQENGGTQKFRCRECPMEFSSLSELNQHERIHPVANPTLTIDGREVTGDNFRLTRSVGSEDIVLNFVDEIELNGVVLGHPDELLKQLSSAKKGFFDIKLSRRGIRPKRIKIDLLVASTSQLEQVDQSFLRLFGRDDFDGDTIAVFISQTEHCNEVTWYKDGLVRYLHGVMAKDQRAERLTTEDFAKCFNRSHQLLMQYPTALAYSLSQLIKFSFNDFSDFQGRSSISRLDDALMLFRGDRISANAAQQNEFLRLPTDHITSCILNDYVAHFSRYTLESLELAISQINISKLVNQDRQKLNYLRYLKATEVGDLKAWRNYGSKLKYSEVFNVTVPESEASDD